MKRIELETSLQAARLCLLDAPQRARINLRVIDRMNVPLFGQLTWMALRAFARTGHSEFRFTAELPSDLDLTDIKLTKTSLRQKIAHTTDGPLTAYVAIYRALGLVEHGYDLTTVADNLTAVLTEDLGLDLSGELPSQESC